MLRGAFEFQGQKCSAASRAYVARSVWKKMRDSFVAEVESITMGDVTDFSNFMGAVIDDRAFAKHKKAIARAKRSPKLDVLAGGQVDDSVGYFVRPTVVEGGDPTDQMFSTEYFGPILAVHVFEDRDFEQVVAQMESFAPYALTGVDHRPGPQCDRLGAGAAAVRRRQLLRQRQADRCGRRPAAVRRCPRVRHERQGRLGAEPAALDVPALDQGDVRPAEGLPLPVHGPRLRPG